MRIVINNCYGGFGVSKQFMDYYKIPNEKICSNSYYPIEEIKRTDKRLIEYIENFGSKQASGNCANLIIVEVEKGTMYRIDEYDGFETLKTMRCDHDWKIADE